MKRWLLSACFATALVTLGSPAFALPTVNDVQAQVQKGNYADAQTMMRQVVEARPGSAKAHYIYAEILAHNARFADAAEQVRIAKQTDPAIKFTDAEKFRSFEALLDREQQRGTAPAPAPRTVEPTRAPMGSVAPAVAPAVRPAEVPVERSAGIPAWVWIAVAVVAFGAWRLMRTRAAPAMGGGMAAAPFANAGPQAPYGPAPGYGTGGGYGGSGLMQQPGRGGSGLLGTGLAAAGGVAAGMMAERWLEGNREHGGNPGNAAVDGNGGFGGGNGFNSQPDPAAAQQLENRDVDFGTGNDWDSGASDGGSFDTGGSGGSDDW